MEEQLLIRSFGFGVFLAELVPPEAVRRGPPKNGDGRAALSKVRRMLEKSGLGEIMDVVPDQEDMGRAYFVLREGQPPCRIEMDQMSGDEARRLRLAAESAASSVLSSRISMLDEEISKTAPAGAAQPAA